MACLEEIQLVANRPIGDAVSLPFPSYHAIEVHQAEQASIFSQDWIFVGFEADIPNPGDYQTLVLAGEPIAVIRGSDNQLRALSNVCRHRGAVLLKGSGSLTKNRVSCPYHAWTYSTEGSLKAVPYPGEVNVNKESHCLPQFRLEHMFGMVFVNLSKHAPPLEERFEGLHQYYSQYEVAAFSHSPGTGSEHWNSNWKLAMENFLEGYHFFSVHKATIEPVAPTGKVYYMEGNTDWSVSGGKQKEFTRTLFGKMKPRDEEIEYLTICMPPNFVGLLYKDHMSWARVLPTGPTTCEITYGVASRFPYRVTKRELEFNDRFFAEDREICERVQEGMSSQRSAGGQLLELERAIVDFHQYLAKWLSGGTALSRSSS